MMRVSKIMPLIGMLLLTTSIGASAEAEPGVLKPVFVDSYSAFVKQLESGQTEINYLEFRNSFIESEQFKLASQKQDEFKRLKQEMYKQMKDQKYHDIINTTKAMLSIDYTSMLAHKILQQTYKILGDSANENKYKAIEFGLLKSIVKNGDGKACASAWPVIQIQEEHFVLEMLGAKKLIQQSVDSVGGLCDKMEVEIDGGKSTYYFEISKVFVGYKKLGIQ
jgi:Domain of unknown function (DUF4919)